ncbi:MAG TPA: adenosine deaminase [Anaerolineales bacterium]|nr:adenosine deaminase [Anaerolineales bacterium]
MKRNPAPKRAFEFYLGLPKVELHRHLEGSLRLDTLVEVARLHGMSIAGTDRLRALVQVGQEEPYTFQNFLSKFETLRLFYRSPDIIGRITREAIADAARDNVRYMEMRFTPMALSKSQEFSLAEVIDWVIEGVRQAEAEFNIITRLIMSFNRHEAVEIAEKVTQLAIDRMDKGVVGLDMAGNEAEYPGQPFEGLFKEAHKAGLKITVHAGEWGGPENVADAIVNLHADRIGHGVRVMEDPLVVGLAAERQTAFEVCVTSNYQSGVFPNLAAHPLPRMLAAGLNATINTDDPRISQITLSDEYRTVTEDLGLPIHSLRNRVLAAAQAAFLPETERQALVQRLGAEFDKSVPPLPSLED